MQDYHGKGLILGIPHTALVTGIYYGIGPKDYRRTVAFNSVITYKIQVTICEEIAVLLL